MRPVTTTTTPSARTLGGRQVVGGIRSIQKWIHPRLKETQKSFRPHISLFLPSLRSHTSDNGFSLFAFSRNPLVASAMESTPSSGLRVCLSVCQTKRNKLLVREALFTLCGNQIKMFRHLIRHQRTSVPLVIIIINMCRYIDTNLRFL